MGPLKKINKKSSFYLFFFPFHAAVCTRRHLVLMFYGELDAHNWRVESRYGALGVRQIGLSKDGPPHARDVMVWASIFQKGGAQSAHGATCRSLSTDGVGVWRMEQSWSSNTSLGVRQICLSVGALRHARQGTGWTVRARKSAQKGKVFLIFGKCRGPKN